MFKYPFVDYKTGWYGGSSMKGKKLSEKTKKKIARTKRRKAQRKGKIYRSSCKYSVDWTNSLRISIRERDNYTCQICGEKQGDRAHSVHHIDYDKHNCNPNNLITLCTKCHSKTNTKRKYWIQFFKDLMNK